MLLGHVWTYKLKNEQLRLTFVFVGYLWTLTLQIEQLRLTLCFWVLVDLKFTKCCLNPGICGPTN